jgi:hypothetical protein
MSAVNGLGRERRQQRHGIAQQLGQDAAGAEHQHLAELRVDRHADQNLGHAVRHHLLDQQGIGQTRTGAGRPRGIAGSAYIDNHRADVRLVLQRLRRWP